MWGQVRLQSGPMLVIDGDLHPRFLPDSTSRYIRNGVGTSADGKRAVFAISGIPVTFHQFGRLFQDGINVPNALYFDGKVSRLYAPELDRSDAGFRLGPIVGTSLYQIDHSLPYICACILMLPLILYVWQFGRSLRKKSDIYQSVG